ncbi:hypothetical protein [Yoonia sp. R2-816]
MASSKPKGEKQSPTPQPKTPSAAALQSNGKPSAPVFTDYASI